MAAIYPNYGPVTTSADEERKKSRRRSSDLLWKDYFRDPSQWLDHRNTKPSPNHPDFKHKVTKEPLWLDSWSNPSWVLEELKRSGLALDEEARNGKLFQGESAAFVASLRSCTKNKDLYRGTKLHDDILKRGLLQECSDALVIMYAKCDMLDKATALHDTHKSRNVMTWNALIAAYARNGQGQNALNCFDRMQHEGVSPSGVTYASILKACGALRASDKGEEIHDQIARQGLLQHDVVLGTALVDMYAKCGALSKAQSVLEELPSRDVVSWNALITGYAQEGKGEQALSCFERMHNEGIPPNMMTYSCILKACGAIGAIAKGKQIHDQIVKLKSLSDNAVLGTALVDMYAKCGALSKAQHVLEELPSRNVLTWSALIAGYAQDGQAEQALNCFDRMQGERIRPNGVTYACVLKACGELRALDKGLQIHEQICRQGLLQNNVLLGTALVDMYAKCGGFSKAHEVLEELPSRDVVSWNALITGYAQKDQGEKALSCYEQMKTEGIPPNAVTYIGILNACSSMRDIDRGKKIHDEITRQRLLQNNVMLGTALVNMYAKCGALSKARLLLEELPSRDVVSWNALIAGYVQVGQGEQALSFFECMQCEGVRPNEVTFGCILNVCCHLGLVEEGYAFFVDMNTKYSLKPNLECYNCMVDLFGRAGHLDRAVRLIREMPSSNYLSIWRTLLGACREWKNVNLGRWAFEQAVRVDKRDASTYVLMADIYAAAGLDGNAREIKAMIVRYTQET